MTQRRDGLSPAPTPSPDPGTGRPVADPIRHSATPDLAAASARTDEENEPAGPEPAAATDASEPTSSVSAPSLDDVLFGTATARGADTDRAPDRPRSEPLDDEPSPADHPARRGGRAGTALVATSRAVSRHRRPHPARIAPPPLVATPRPGGPAWPSVNKKQGRHKLSKTADRVRYARSLARGETKIEVQPPTVDRSQLLWALFVVGAFVFVLLRTSANRMEPPVAAATVPTMRVTPAHPTTSSPTRAAAASAPAAAPAPGKVTVTVLLADGNRVVRSVPGSVVLAGRPLVPAGTPLTLPLVVTATAAPGDRLSVSVPSIPAGSYVTCAVTATGAITGSMTRSPTGTSLDCTTTVKAIATGGS